MRVGVYIDGFNLYYRALKHTRYKWLNPVELARSVLKPDDHIEFVRYFTARVSPRAGNPTAPRDQQVYLSALETLPEITIHYGSFLAKTKRRPLVTPLLGLPTFVDVHDSEEKGSDVNLAVHLLNDAWLDRFDAALLVSQDTDLCEPARMVRDERHKILGLVSLDERQPNKRLRKFASFVQYVTPARLSGAQFPDKVVGSRGPIHKPAGW